MWSSVCGLQVDMLCLARVCGISMLCHVVLGCVVYESMLCLVVCVVCRQNGVSEAFYHRQSHIEHGTHVSLELVQTPVNETIGGTVYRDETIGGTVYRAETIGGTVYRDETIGGTVYREEIIGATVYRDETVCAMTSNYQPIIFQLHFHYLNKYIYIYSIVLYK